MLHPAAAKSGIGEPERSPRPDRSNRANTEIRVQTLRAIERQLAGYRLTTAEILYHFPDHPELLQSYVWQDLDIAPRYPVLNKFLAFWQRELEGRLHSVRVGTVDLITPGSWHHAVQVMQIH
jgi:uncharacterized protein Usg